MKEARRDYWFRVVILSVLGLVGVLSAIPLIPKLIQISGQQAPLPLAVLYIISTVQSSALVIAMVLLGAWASPKVNLRTPYIDSYLNSSLSQIKYKETFLAALFGGVLGGVLLIGWYRIFTPILPAEFIQNVKGFSPPVYTKLLYGGITEEILIRFGLMSFFTWGLFRVTQKNTSAIGAHNYVLAILFSSLLFGVGHLPAANFLSPVITSNLVVYIILGNSIFGVIAGFLYWKRGLEAAIISHMVAHLVMIVGEKIA
jgi:membrane protease YdiL (CAAX protease family)